MDKGNIMQEGAPLDVYNHPQNLFVAGFIGSPAMNLMSARIVEQDGGLIAQGEGVAFSVPAEKRERYGKALGREVVLGLRPEHIFDKNLKGVFPGGEPLLGIVEVYEPMGSQVILRARCGPHRVVAALDPKTAARAHDEIEFLVDTHHLHIFDKETERVY
jgi:multiple sugar transport system ATP-binding protein